jgi:hypothetical protein
MRRRLPLLVWVGVAVAFIAASAVQFHTRGERLAQSRLIDEEHYDRVKIGMQMEEVEAILGGPPGRLGTRRVSLVAPPRDSGPVPDKWFREVSWWGDQGVIQVYLTEQGTVGRSVFWRAAPAPSRPLGDRVQSGFRRLAEQVRDRLPRLGH